MTIILPNLIAVAPFILTGVGDRLQKLGACSALWACCALWLVLLRVFGGAFSVPHFELFVDELLMGVMVVFSFTELVEILVL